MTKTKAKKKSPLPECEFTPEQFRGIVVVLSLRCHSTLPQSLRNSIDANDLIQEGMMFLTRVIYRLGGRKAVFAPQRAQASTWVFSLMVNFYRGWHEKHVTTKKRSVDMVALDDNIGAQNAHAASSRYGEFVDAVSKVEALHRSASLDLVEFLDTNLFQTPERIARARGARFEKYAQEFRALAKRYNVTSSDYRLVMRACCRTTSEA
jgi:DNA-directed RNA polymerase specialized sigma24 family protein